MRTVIFVANDYEAENIFSLKEFSIVENEPFKTWKHSTKNIYVVITGIGKTNAGAAAQWALLKFDPDHCINLGLVGGLNTKLKIGEVMQVSACAFHDVDLTPFGYMHGQLPGSGLVKYELFSDSDQTYRPGTLITGDVFVDDKSKIEKSLQLHSPLALDMELASIAHTMHINKKLQKLRAYKAVSDYVNKESAGDYRGNADMFKQLQDLALKLIERA